MAQIRRMHPHAAAQHPRGEAGSRKAWRDWATVCELIAAGAIYIGVREVYAPLGWLWIGVCAIALSYLLELEKRDQRRPAPGAGDQDVDQQLDMQEGLSAPREPSTSMFTGGGM